MNPSVVDVRFFLSKLKNRNEKSFCMTAAASFFYLVDNAATSAQKIVLTKTAKVKDNFHFLPVSFLPLSLNFTIFSPSHFLPFAWPFEIPLHSISTFFA